MTTEEFQAQLVQAEAGDMNAQNQVANTYANALGVEKDLAKAFEWYLKSAEQGQLNSMMNVGGWCYLYGNGTAVDYEKAYLWMEKVIAADQKDDWSLNAYAHALNNYGWELYVGKRNGSTFGAVKDVNKAAELFRKSSETGRCCYATTNLGNCYQTGQGVAKDLHKAKELYDKAFAAGQPKNDIVNGWLKELEDELAKEATASSGAFSMSNSGSAFSDISVVPAFERQRQEEEARKKAEEEAKRKAEEEAPRREFEKLLALAEQGDAVAQCDVAIAFTNAKGVEVDLKKAFEWFQKSARQGNTCAMGNLGCFCYLGGKGTDKNAELAVYWLKKAWDGGYQNDWSKDKYGRALLLRAGDYTSLSKEILEKILKTYNLDRLEIEKEFGSFSNWKAKMDSLKKEEEEYNAKIFQLSLEASKYTPLAYQLLAMFFRNGSGVEKDIVKAKEWADKAFAAGECGTLEGDWIISLEKELEEYNQQLAEKQRQEEIERRRMEDKARETEKKAAEAQAKKKE